MLIVLMVTVSLQGCNTNRVIDTQGNPITKDDSGLNFKRTEFNYHDLINQVETEDFLEIQDGGFYQQNGEDKNTGYFLLRMRFKNVQQSIIASHKEALSRFFNVFSSVIADQLNIEVRNLKLKARLNDCMFYVSDRKVEDIKCEKKPVKAVILPENSNVLDKIKYFTEKHGACLVLGIDSRKCLSYGRVIDKQKLHRFCLDKLKEKLSDYYLNAECIVEHKENQQYFLIKDLKTKSYVTDGYWERFSIKLSYFNGKNQDGEFYGDLQMIDGKCGSQITFSQDRPDPKYVKDTFSDCGKNSFRKKDAKEQELAAAFNRYFKAQTDE